MEQDFAMVAIYDSVAFFGLDHIGKATRGGVAVVLSLEESTLGD